MVVPCSRPSASDASEYWQSRACSQRAIIKLCRTNYLCGNGADAGSVLTACIVSVRVAYGLSAVGRFFFGVRVVLPYALMFIERSGDQYSLVKDGCRRGFALVRAASDKALNSASRECASRGPSTCPRDEETLFGLHAVADPCSQKQETRHWAGFLVGNAGT